MNTTTTRTASPAVPLQAVDTFTAAGDTFTVTKTVTAEDPYLPGHFPGNPIYPGVFYLETVRQAIEKWHCHQPATSTITITMIRHARFTRPARAGDTITVTGHCTRTGDETVDVDAIIDIDHSAGGTLQLTLTLQR